MSVCHLEKLLASKKTVRTFYKCAQELSKIGISVFHAYIRTLSRVYKKGNFFSLFLTTSDECMNCIDDDKNSDRDRFCLG